MHIIKIAAKSTACADGSSCLFGGFREFIGTVLAIVESKVALVREKMGIAELGWPI